MKIILFTLATLIGALAFILLIAEMEISLLAFVGVKLACMAVLYLSCCAVARSGVINFEEDNL